MSWEKTLKQGDFNKPPNDFNKPRDLNNPGTNYQRTVPPNVLKQIQDLLNSPLLKDLETMLENTNIVVLDNMFNELILTLGKMEDFADGTHDKDGNPIQ